MQNGNKLGKEHRCRKGSPDCRQKLSQDCQAVSKQASLLMGSINERFIAQAWEKMTVAVGPGDASAGDAEHNTL